MRKTWLEDLFVASSGAIPASWAISRAPLVPDVAHSLGTARTTGFGWTGAFRSLDMVWAAPFEALPIGTRTFRAALASACALAVLGVVTHLVARRLLASLVPKGGLLAVALATVAAAMTTLAPSAQLEGAAPAGATFGAALALLPMLLVLQRRTGWAFFVVGLCAAYELDVFACALPAVVLLRERPTKRALAFFSLGLVPFACAWALQRSFPAAIALGARPLASPLGEGPPSTVGLRAMADELGIAGFTLACGGAALALLRRYARHQGAALLGVLVLGVALTRLGAPAGPDRFAPCVIAALAAACTLASGAMQELAVQIARIDVPYARASSVMVVVLESVMPLKTADDTVIRLAERADKTAEWSTDAVLPLAPHAAIVTGTGPILQILVALRASGELAPDVTIVPTNDAFGRLATHAVLRDPSLTPLARDLVLSGTPQEYALSEIATTRPLFLSYDPRWDRALARHLVAQGAFDRFLGEPRGPSDRKRALDAFAPMRDRLARATRGDTELRHATASLLRARALAVGAAGDRNAAVRSVEDLRRFSPTDTTGGEIVKRIISVEGPVDVADLSTLE